MSLLAQGQSDAVTVVSVSLKVYYTSEFKGNNSGVEDELEAAISNVNQVYT